MSNIQEQDYKNPLVSIIMPVYNAVCYLEQSVLSILNQTYNNFEFIIINDGSSDNSLAKLNSFKDKRIKLVNLKKNSGIEIALNHGLQKAKGEYIARMDADDISLPKRIALQVAFLQKHKHIDLVGTDALFFKNKRITDYREYFDKQYELIVRSIFNCPLLHPTIMFRKKLIKNKLKYLQGYQYAEDYKLFIDILKTGKVSNINKPLLLYRQQTNRQESLYAKRQKQSLLKIFKEQFEHLQWPFTLKDLNNHYILATANLPDSSKKQTLVEVESWINQLLKYNRKSNLFEPLIFSKYIGLLYLRLIFRGFRNNIFHINLLLLFKIPILKIFNFLIKTFAYRLYYSFGYDSSTILSYDK